MNVVAVCEWCGASFEKKRRTKRFCSNKCGNAQRNARWLEAKPDARQAILERYRDWNREKVRDANRRYSQAHPDRVLESMRRYRANNPEKVRAHWTVNRALRNGRLVRPEQCESCGAAEGVLHAHHADYAKPLAIEWLCPLCHKAQHAQMVAA